MDAIAPMIDFVDTESAGTTTFILGMDLMIAMSSTCWWDAPSGPTEIPPWEHTIFTFKFGYAMLFLIWSTDFPGTKMAYVPAYTTLPARARPAAIETRFCSAMPTLKNRSGNFVADTPDFSEPVVSA